MLMNGKNGTKAFGLGKNAAVATAAKTSPLLAPAPAAVTLKTEGPAPDYVDQVGDNVGIAVTGDILTITVDLRKNFGASSSGKTSVIASTRGFASIATHRGVSIALNVNRK